MNNILFFLLVILVIIGLIVVGVGLVAAVKLIQYHFAFKKLKAKREQARNQDYEGMKQSLLSFFEPGQGATV